MLYGSQLHWCSSSDCIWWNWSVMLLSPLKTREVTSNRTSFRRLSSTLVEFTISSSSGTFSSHLLFHALVTVTVITDSQTVFLLTATLLPPIVTSWLGSKVFLNVLLAGNHGDTTITCRFLLLCVQKNSHKCYYTGHLHIGSRYICLISWYMTLFLPVLSTVQHVERKHINCLYPYMVVGHVTHYLR